MAWVAPLASAHLVVPQRQGALRDRPRRTKPRIGLVIHDFALGGTERIAVRLANKWVELGVEVDLFCGAQSGPLRDLLHPSVQVSSPTRPIRRGPGSLQRLGIAARGHFEKRPVDALYVPGNTHWPVIRPLATLVPARRPRIIVQISAALEKPQRGRLRQHSFVFRMRRKLSGADHVIGMSWESARLARRMLRREDVKVIPLPALDDRALPVQPLPDKAKPVVFAAARLVPGKGLENLVRAFARLQHPAATLVIAGTGPSEAALRRLIAELGLGGKVDLLGYVPDIRPWLDRSHFLVMPSDHEGYGAVIVEALAAGRPVLATDCSPAVRESLHEPDAGEVVPVGDVDALCAGLAAMIVRDDVDPQLLAAKVDRFRIGPVARRYLSLVGIVPGLRGSPARWLKADNDTGDEAVDCANGGAAL
jgi:glycosyltransferase involved in cell wall biosynthesis